jgi:hypothetical protein
VHFVKKILKNKNKIFAFFLEIIMDLKKNKSIKNVKSKKIKTVPLKTLKKIHF